MQILNAQERVGDLLCRAASRKGRALSYIHKAFSFRRLTMGEGLFQPMHLLVILVIAILVFWPRKLADLGKGLGKGIRSF
jgi:TatA/E family protein of Tat protein translocase